MAKVTISVRGLSDMQANTAKMLENLRVGTEEALDTVAQENLEFSRNVCPVGTPESTGKKNYQGGKLKASLQVYQEPLVRQVGTDVDYGWYVHDGTYKMAARPFLTQGFEASQGRLVSDCQRIKLI